MTPPTAPDTGAIRLKLEADAQRSPMDPIRWEWNPADIAALLAEVERLRTEKREAVSKIYLILGDAKYDRYSEQINAAKDECEKTLFPKAKEGDTP